MANQRIIYGIHKMAFGWCAIGIMKEGVCYLSFPKTNGASETIRAIRALWPSAELTRSDAKTKRYVQKIFKTGNSKFPLVVKGTDFQMKVWQALLAIPRGKTKSYGEIAKAIGAPKAVRAVGSACGKNSIAYLIPCHRVLTSTGGIGGYRWGTATKRAILAVEKK